MKKTHFKSILLVVFLLVMLSNSGMAQKDMPIDKKATKETMHLYQNLKRISQKGYLFGHQDATAYGVGWRELDDKSDVKDVTGEFPGLYGWDLSGIELQSPKNIDGVVFSNTRKLVQQAYRRGGVNTFSWHCPSPFGYTKGAWDTTKGTVKSVLPGGVNHVKYNVWLDNIAAFFLRLKDDHNQLIPVLFRPYHELSGNWFWWGTSACTPEEFKAIWRYTINYLCDVKQVHSLLYVYNTGGDFKTKEEYLERYPGDDYADVLSFDSYQFNDPSKNDDFIKKVDAKLTILDNLAKEKNKIEALAETGYEAIPYPEWWTKTLAVAIGSHPISYVLLWRNAGFVESMKKMHYYVPFKGQVSEKDFISFSKMDRTLFEKDAKKEKLYQ
jgi:mannan endo-1,4-beta-mannosidase